MKSDALDRFLITLSALHRIRALYPAGNDLVLREGRKAAAHLREWGAPVRLTLLGEDAVAEDRSIGSISSGLRSLIQAIRAKGCETVRIEPAASEGDLIAWVAFLGTGGEGPFVSPHVVAGTLAEDGLSADGNARQAEIALGYLSLRPKAEEALDGIAALRPEGLALAQEIVRAIAAHVASGEDLLSPVRALKGHDEYTFTHALNVCVIATALGKNLGTEGPLLDALGLAALCHDVGKQVIPLEVLNKAGRLEPREREVMDGHPVEGARILLAGRTDGLPAILPVVAYQHHMNADGSGYPRPFHGVKPHAVSLLVAVADVFDALRTVRPYRPAWSEAATCTVLVRDAGNGKLHGGYVTALLSMLRALPPGRSVGLSDGRRAVVLECGSPDYLKPKVESEDGQILDLSVRGAPWIDHLPEPAP